MELVTETGSTATILHRKGPNMVRFEWTGAIINPHEHLSLKIPNVEKNLKLGFRHECTDGSKPNFKFSFAGYDKDSYFQF